MRILHVIASISPVLGGPGPACVGLAEAMAARGHKVTICTSDWKDVGVRYDQPLATPVSLNGVVYRFHRMARFKVLAASMHMARELPGLIADADLAHVHSLYLFHDWMAARHARRAGVAYVVTPHGSVDPYIFRRHRFRKAIVERLFQDRVNRGAAAFHFTTEDERRLAVETIGEVPAMVVPLGLDAARFAAAPPPGAFRAKWPQVGERRIVLFFGRLNFKKGMDILAPAFARAVRAGLDLHLVLAGPDHGMAATMRGWLAEHGVAERATFTGMLGPEDSLAALHESAAFVLPSYSENFGIAVIEAMACGLPVLISDRVNIWREVVADGAGRACAPEIDAFSDLLIDALSNTQALEDMAAAGPKSVAERFSWPRIGARLETAYADVLARAAQK